MYVALELAKWVGRGPGAAWLQEQQRVSVISWRDVEGADTWRVPLLHSAVLRAC